MERAEDLTPRIPRITALPTTPSPHVPGPGETFGDDGCSGFHLTEGGSLSILHFDDGEHRLMFERGDVSWGLRLSDTDVKNLRSVTGDSVMRAA